MKNVSFIAYLLLSPLQSSFCDMFYAKTSGKLYQNVQLLDELFAAI